MHLVYHPSILLLSIHPSIHLCNNHPFIPHSFSTLVHSFHSFAGTQTLAVSINSTQGVEVSYGNVSHDVGFVVDAGQWNKLVAVYEGLTGELNVYYFNTSNLVKRRKLTLDTDIFATEGTFAVGQWLPPTDGVYYTPTTDFTGYVQSKIELSV